MLKRLYVHNFRCFENFELRLDQQSSALLIGRNGVGKSTVATCLEILQRIGRGTNRVGKLVKPKDFSRGRASVPMRFEIEVTIFGKDYQYTLALEFPDNFKELRVLEENLRVSGNTIYSRNQAQVSLSRNASGRSEAQFSVDWHMVALPLIQEQSSADPLSIFRNWLAHMVILAPIPARMTGISKEECLEPEKDGANFSDWLSGLLGRYPAAYSTIYEYLKEVMPDISEFANDLAGRDTKIMNVSFSVDNENFVMNFDDISDGEKCFFLCAVVLSANKAYGPLFCFWDEPDHYLSLSEVGAFILALRRSSIKKGGQFIATSHHPETIIKFSDENTWMLDRKNHLEPTLVRLLKDIPREGDLIESLTIGEIRL